MTTAVLPDEDVQEHLDNHARCTRIKSRRLMGVWIRSARCHRRATWKGRFSRCDHDVDVCSKHLRDTSAPWRCAACGEKPQAIIAARPLQ